MFTTDDHFVPFGALNGRLEAKHRRLVRQHITAKQRNRYLDVGRPGKISGTLRWRLESAPCKSSNSSKDHSQEGSKAFLPIVATKVLPSVTRAAILTGNSHDPFDSLPVATCGTVDPFRTLSYVFEEQWAPMLELQSATNPSYDYCPFVTKILPLATQNTELLAAILTDAQHWHDYRSSATDHRPLLEYRGQTIRNIRLKLLASQSDPSSVVDDATIVAMSFLMGVDSYRQDKSSEAAHRLALQKIVASRGGIASLDPFVRCLPLQQNFWLQQDNGTPPLFNRKEYVNQEQLLDWPCLPSTSAIEEARSALPLIFSNLIQSWTPSVQTLNILARTQQWTLTLDRLWSDKATDDDFAAFARSDAVMILEDVVHVQTQIKVQKNNATFETASWHKIELLITQVLVLYLLNTLFKKIAQTRPIYLNARAEASISLMKRLMEVPKPLLATTLNRDLVLWSAIVVIDSYRRVNNVIDLPGVSLMAALVNMCPAAKEWDSLEQVLQGGFWYGAMVRGWKICWEKGCLM